MNVWDTKDYNKFYKDYIYVVIGQEDLTIIDKPKITLYHKIILQRYKIVNDNKISDRVIKVNADILHGEKYHRIYRDTYIRIKNNIICRIGIQKTIINYIKIMFI